MTIPRRIAPDEDPPGMLRSRLRVFVDGDLLRDVVAYDIDEGWVLLVKHDDGFLARKVFGKVEVGVI